jgi:hypothetical protein
MLVPDNLRSAVKSFDKWSPGITDGLNDLATHYGCCALPTRVRKPKDKALVEDAVHKGYKRIYAPLRNRVFHSIVELNKAIAELLEKYNNRLCKDVIISGRAIPGRRETRASSFATTLYQMSGMPF